MLSLESKALIQHYQDQITVSLNSFLQAQYPHHPLRFSQILMRIGSIKLVSVVWWKHARMEQLQNYSSILSGLFDFL